MRGVIRALFRTFPHNVTMDFSSIYTSPIGTRMLINLFLEVSDIGTVTFVDEEPTFHDSVN